MAHISNEDKIKIEKAQKILNRVGLHAKKRFKCRVIDYGSERKLSLAYRVEFSQGGKIIIEDIPRRYIEDSGEKTTPELLNLFDEIERKVGSGGGETE
jgi:ABC-type branched-subunit amino acid transport system ATPase component